VASGHTVLAPRGHALSWAALGPATLCLFHAWGFWHLSPVPVVFGHYLRTGVGQRDYCPPPMFHRSGLLFDSLPTRQILTISLVPGCGIRNTKLRRELRLSLANFPGRFSTALLVELHLDFRF
jgi:hypothetical protein